MGIRTKGIGIVLFLLLLDLVLPGDETYSSHPALSTYSAALFYMMSIAAATVNDSNVECPPAPRFRARSLPEVSQYSYNPSDVEVKVPLDGFWAKLYALLFYVYSYCSFQNVCGFKRERKVIDVRNFTQADSTTHLLTACYITCSLPSVQPRAPSTSQVAWLW